MLTTERKTTILHILDEHSSVTVNRLTETLGVSEVTVRKMLNNMARKGLLRRTHGGATSLSAPVREYDMQAKEKSHTREKKDIARAAFECINDYDAVFLDAGTTTLELARLIRNERKRNITIITNAVNIAMELLDARDIEVMVIGGSLRHDVISCVGPAAEAMVDNLVFDKAFMGANNVSPEHGATTPDQTEASFKRRVSAAAREVFLLCDASKFTGSSMSRIRPVQDFTGIITDNSLSQPHREALRAAGANLIMSRAE